MSHDLHVPLRARVYDMSNGDKQIHINLNGNLVFVFHYDPKENTLTEVPLPTDMHHMKKESKPYPAREHQIIDNVNKLGKSYADDDTQPLTPLPEKPL